MASSVQAALVRGSQKLTFYLHNNFITDLSLLFDYAVVFLSGGIPYWYYRWFHRSLPSTDTDFGDTDRSGLRDHWAQVAREVPDVWKTHNSIVAVALSVTFPLISVSPLPKCSWAYIFAIITLVYGLITLAICAIHGVYVRAIDIHNLPASWDLPPGSSFLHRDVVGFYVFLSLPSVWLVGFIASFAMTLLMVATGVLPTDEFSESDRTASQSSAPCNNLKLLLGVVPLILVLAATTSSRSARYARKNTHDEEHPLMLDEFPR